MSNEIMQETTTLVECSAFHRAMSVLEASLRNTEDSEAIINGLLKGVAEFYEEYETNRLRRLFSAFECVAELNADLLKSTVSEVLVTRQNVKLRLKNGQVIERSDLQ